MSKLTAIVPTFNEADNIEECLAGLAWADEILVVDSFSEDGTPDLARAAGARVLQRAYKNSADQKNWAIPQAEHPWVFLLDADERCTPELASEVLAVLASGPEKDGYWIWRRNFFLGKEIRHGGWDNDKVIRLFRRDLRYQELAVHADIDVPFARVGRLKQRMLHYSFDSLEQYYEKRLRYADWASHQLDKEGRRGHAGFMVLRSSLQFLKMYVLRGGFRDGMHGFVLAFLHAFYVAAKYVRLWERQLPPHARAGIRNQGVASKKEGAKVDTTC